MIDVGIVGWAMGVRANARIDVCKCTLRPHCERRCVASLRAREGERGFNELFEKLDPTLYIGKGECARKAKAKPIVTLFP